MKTRKKIASSVAILFALIICMTCNVACSNSSSSRSSRGDGTTATVYSYRDGTELYVVYDNGIVLDARNGDQGIWSRSSAEIGPRTVPFIELVFDGHTTSCSICEGKLYWGGIGAVKGSYPNGTPAISRRK